MTNGKFTRWWQVLLSCNTKKSEIFSLVNHHWSACHRNFHLMSMSKPIIQLFVNCWFVSFFLKIVLINVAIVIHLFLQGFPAQPANCRLLEQLCSAPRPGWRWGLHDPRTLHPHSLRSLSSSGTPYVHIDNLLIFMLLLYLCCFFPANHTIHMKHIYYTYKS